MTRTPKPVRLSRPILAAVILVFVALQIALLWMAGVPLNAWSGLWPVLAGLAGLVLLIDFFAGSRSPSSLGWAVAALATGLAGAFPLGMSHGQPLGPAQWWPAVPFLASLGFLAAWIGGRGRNHLSLILGTVATILAVDVFLRSEWWFQLFPTPTLPWIIILVIAAGLAAAAFVRKRTEAPKLAPPSTD